MKFSHIISKLHGIPWLITEAGHGAVIQAVDRHLDNFGAREPGEDICGDKVEVPQMEITDGAAVIPVSGILAPKLTKFQRGFGATDYNDIISDLNEAAQNDEVNRVIMAVDSPGGMVTGCQETANKMMQTREQKPVYTFVDGMAASAAYWLAASSDRIYSSLSAELGGVGVYLPVLDQSKAFEARGMKMHVIKAGRYKAIGFPGTKLTEDQEFHLQESVNQVYSEFKDHVQSNRQIDADNLEGQTFSGRNTFDKGFSDEQASSLLEVINATQPSIIEEE